MLRIKHLLRATLFAYATDSVLCTSETVFGTGAPGYLFNEGSKVFLTWSRTPKERYLWVKGTKSPQDASRFQIHRSKYHSATYSLIMPDEPKLTSLFKKVNNASAEFPFFGMPTMSLLGNNTSPYIGFTTDTSNSNTWFSFSPPVTKKNHFKIYLNNQCLEVEGEGYMRIQECTLVPEDKKIKQLFRWLSENEYLAYKTENDDKDSPGNRDPVIIDNLVHPIYKNPLAPSRSQVKAQMKNEKKRLASQASKKASQTLKNIQSGLTIQVTRMPEGYYDNPSPSKTLEEDALTESRRRVNYEKVIQSEKVDMPPGF
ncbi:hypothetical protein NEMIN01_0545 [Nematocida minor]|uniref:uncharacterized protein n=1 Tax=Nematocida minor TaxID=1912983 RepID=UPI00221F2859|nr:uncharacterized protein NEMIN01_0545 [Nematocida minor]KAI5189482.1 hypothetical protein NEMIN01_0545 [Nematocida minor]